MNELDVRKIRKNLGLTQKQLAEKLGVDIKTVQNWESGKVVPKTKYGLFRNLATIDGVTSVSVTGNDNAVNNSNCQISHGNTANGALDSLQAENTALRKEIAELRSALLDLTRQNQRLMDKLLSLMDGPNTSATARQ